MRIRHPRVLIGGALALAVILGLPLARRLTPPSATTSAITVPDDVEAFTFGSHLPALPLDQLPTPQTIDRLVDALDSPDPEVRREALIDLNYIGWLIDAASKPTWEVNQPALRARVAATRERLIAAVPDLARVVRQGVILDRDEASWALARLGAAADVATPALVDFASDEALPARIRQHALVALARVAGPASVPTLVRAGGAGQDLLVRYAAIRSLIYAGPDARPALVPLLQDPDPLMRGTAARVLGRIGPTAADSAEAILAAYRHDDVLSVRLSALEAWSKVSVNLVSTQRILREVLATEPLAPLCHVALAALRRFPGDATEPVACNGRETRPGNYERVNEAVFTSGLAVTFPGARVDEGPTVLARVDRSPSPRLGIWRTGGGGVWLEGGDSPLLESGLWVGVGGLGIGEERVVDGTPRLDRPSEGVPGLVAVARVTDDGRILDRKVLRLHPEYWEVDIRTIKPVLVEGVEDFGTRWPLVRLWVRQRLAPDSAIGVESQLVCDLEHDRCLTETPVSTFVAASGRVIRTFDGSDADRAFRGSSPPAYARIIEIMTGPPGPKTVVTASDVLATWDWRHVAVSGGGDVLSWRP